MKNWPITISEMSSRAATTDRTDLSMATHCRAWAGMDRDALHDHPAPAHQRGDPWHTRHGKVFARLGSMRASCQPTAHCWFGDLDDHSGRPTAGRTAPRRCPTHL